MWPSSSKIEKFASSIQHKERKCTNKKVVLEKKKPKSRSNELYVNLFFDAVQPNLQLPLWRWGCRYVQVMLSEKMFCDNGCMVITYIQHSNSSSALVKLPNVMHESAKQMSDLFE